MSFDAKPVLPTREIYLLQGGMNSPTTHVCLRVSTATHTGLTSPVRAEERTFILPTTRITFPVALPISRVRFRVAASGRGLRPRSDPVWLRMLSNTNKGGRQRLRDPGT
eukprot:363031-Chlamydomonas_euryale.AAC.3